MIRGAGPGASSGSELECSRGDGPPVRRLHLRLAAVALGVLLFEGISQGLYADPDMWHEMSLAREIAASGVVPDRDVFAYTPTVWPVVHHEWGTGMILQALASRAGEHGVLALFYALSGGIVACAVLAMRRSGATAPVALVCSPVAIFLSWIGFSVVRAQMVTLLFTSVLLGLLWRERAGKRRWLAAWVAVMVVWQNMHAGFVVGLAFLFLHALEQALRRRPALPAMALAVLGLALVPLNPWGTAYYGYLARALTMSRPAIGEWQPVTSAFLPLPCMWAFSVLLAAYAAARAGWRQSEGIAIVLVSALAAFLHQRHLSLYALAWFAHVPGWLERTPVGAFLHGAFDRRRRAVAAAALALLACTSVALSRHPLWRIEIPANRGDHPLLVYPVGAVEHLARIGFEGDLLVPFTAGSYVSYRLYPLVHVSIDSRYEVAYPPGALERIHSLYRADEGWQTELQEDGTDAILVPVNAGLASALEHDPGWTLLYQDDAWRVHVRGGESLAKADRVGERIVGRF